MKFNGLGFGACFCIGLSFFFLLEFNGSFIHTMIIMNGALVQGLIGGIVVD
jgi:hypothetical protein